MPQGDTRTLASTSAREVEILGIDPAPSKKTVVWWQGAAQSLSSAEVREFVEDRLKASAVLIAWDAPLTFDPAHGFSDRPVDREARRWIKRKVQQNRVEPGAVSVLPFTGCSHWAISCHVLGRPFGSPPDGLEVAPATYLPPTPGCGFVVEVHPAVALAILWLEKYAHKPFPRYKGGRQFANQCERIAQNLGFPEKAGTCDDALDAYMAWWLADRFTRGEAFFFGESHSGGYLLPRLAAPETQDLLTVATRTNARILPVQ